MIACPEPDAVREVKWFELLESTCPGKDSDSFTPAEWHEVLVGAKKSADDIPY